MVKKELVFKQIRREDSGCVTYLVGSSKTYECAIVDPLLDVDFVIEEANGAGFGRITHVIDTHTHADHISGARSLVKKFNLKGVLMHPSSRYNFQIVPVQDGQILHMGGILLHFLHTPGHTYDHICILIDGSKVLTGDTLLIGDVGRIDLGGNPRDKSDKLYDSLAVVIFHVDDSTEVYPTHVGAAHHLASNNMFSTVGKEKIGNAALKAETKEDFYKYMTEDWPPKPPDYQNIIRVNRGEVAIP